MAATFAVALVGEPTGWLVEAASVDEALDIVAGTVPAAHEASRDELLVWPQRFYRERYLFGNPMPASWARL